MAEEGSINARISSGFPRKLLAMLALQVCLVPSASAQASIHVLEADSFDAAVRAVNAQAGRELVEPLQGDSTWLLLTLTEVGQVLHLATPSLDSYKFYSLHQATALASGGLLIEDSARPIWFPEYLLPLNSEWGEQLLVELHWQLTEPIPVQLMTSTQADRHSALRLLSDGIYYGSNLLMALFALFIGGVYSDRHSGRLSITLLVWLVFVSFSWGYADLLNPFDLKQPAYAFRNPMMCLASLVTAWFCYHFLREAAAGNILLKGLRLCMWTSLAYFLGSSLLPVSAGAAPLLMLVTGFLGVACSVVASLRGDAASRYLVGATLTTSIPFLMLFLTPPSQQFMLIAGTIALILVSLALLKRIGERLRAHELKARMNDERERFLATMSHEIRTPLNGIIGFSELIEQEPMEDKLREYFEQVFRSSRMLVDIVNDVLDYSRMSSDSIPIELQATDLQNMLENVLATINPLAAKNQVQLAYNIGEEVADYIITDQHRCTQILVNLCSNAVKFTRGGEVIIRCSKAANRLHIAVIDDGIGIESAVLQGLFNPFQQAGASTARQYGGSGLGLAISKQLARLLMGDLSAHSEPGAGSTFTLDLPYVEGEAPPLEAKHETIALEGLSILLAEDNPVNALLATRILEKSGIHVDHAEDGSIAVQKVGNRNYDIILMDMQMPELSGTEAAQQIREHGCKAPIIAMTANTSESDREACLAAGMSDYLPKPIVQHHLLSKLEYWSEQIGDRS